MEYNTKFSWTSNWNDNAVGTYLLLCEPIERYVNGKTAVNVEAKRT